ncbi:MAG: hypothetical protein J6K41_11925 [Paraprevotella sp.]|nr:hypothetical protein [Paraprevotella sp.]
MIKPSHPLSTFRLVSYPSTKPIAIATVVVTLCYSCGNSCATVVAYALLRPWHTPSIPLANRNPGKTTAATVMPPQQSS